MGGQGGLRKNWTWSTAVAHNYVSLEMHPTDDKSKGADNDFT